MCALLSILCGPAKGTLIVLLSAMFPGGGSLPNARNRFSSPLFLSLLASDFAVAVSQECFYHHLFCTLTSIKISLKPLLNGPPLSPAAFSL